MPLEVHRWLPARLRVPGYLDNDDVGERSKSALQDLGLLLTSTGKPWVLAGDWSVEPDRFHERASHWLRRVRGHVVDAGEGAC